MSWPATGNESKHFALIADSPLNIPGSEAMDLPTSQDKLLHCLKTRGPQSVKILSNQLDMTTMGVRQHLAELERKALVKKNPEARQNRGRPVHLWQLTRSGHGHFSDTHDVLAADLIQVVQESLGEASLDELISRRNSRITDRYQRQLAGSEQDLPRRLQRLAELRSEDGFMAEVRLVPEGWLLIENHCPISAAAARCQGFCRTELDTFQQLLAPAAVVERVDHLLNGARRCAYRIRAA